MSTEIDPESVHIGTLNEKALHASLKDWYAEPDDVFEVALDGYFIDVVREDLLIEIQTRNFSAMKRKLFDLTERHRVRLVHPIAQQKWIIRTPKGGKGKETRRKSPKRGAIENIFEELVAFPKLMTNPNFTLEVLLIHEEEVRKHDASKRGWRRKGWVTQERRLIDVVDQRRFSTPEDMRIFIPDDLEEPFTTADLAEVLGKPRRLAQQIAYCLRGMGTIEMDGKKGNAILYRRA